MRIEPGVRRNQEPRIKNQDNTRILILGSWLLVLFSWLLALNNLHAGNKYRYFQATHVQSVFEGNRDAPLHSRRAWGMDARVGWYADEKNASFADSLFHYPSFGAGLFYGNLCGIHLGENDDYAHLGSSVALYGFYKAPVFRTKKTQFDWLTGFGISGGHGIWEPEDNPHNTITSTFLNYFILLGVEYRYAFAGKSSLGIGASLRHSSNAAFRQPNHGLNLFSLDVSYRFDGNGNDKQYTPLFNANARVSRRWDWTLSLGYGLQQLEKSERMLLFDKPEYRFSNVTLSSRVMYQLFPKRKFGVGIDVLYSEAGSYLEQIFYPRIPKPDPTSRPEKYYLSQQLNGALVLSHEYGYNRWWLVTELGFYVMPFNGIASEKKQWFYERAGFKYRFSKRFYSAVFVRAQVLTAIHAEWTLGMYLKSGNR